MTEERAWSSPIYVDPPLAPDSATASGAAQPTSGEG
jgi:hypothetical protein